MIDTLADYIGHLGLITDVVVGLLSFYLILALWIFLYRYIILKRWQRRESLSLEQLHLGGRSVTPGSVLSGCVKGGQKIVRDALKICELAATKEATKGLTALSIIASTSPFIGLFGTVVSILETFADLGSQKSASLNVVAPAISEALVATAAGIVVAVFAYTFHLILKRLAYDVTTLVSMQADMMQTMENNRL